MLRFANSMACDTTLVQERPPEERLKKVGKGSEASPEATAAKGPAASSESSLISTASKSAIETASHVRPIVMTSIVEARVLARLSKIKGKRS